MNGPNDLSQSLISAIRPVDSRDASARHVFEEYVSSRHLKGRLVLYDGGKTSRAASLNQLLADLEFGDVEAFLCADVHDFLAMFPTLKSLLLGIHALSKTAIHFSVLERNLTFRTDDARFVLYLVDEFIAAAGKKRATSVRRGLARLAAGGVRLGRPPSVDTAKIEELRRAGRSLREIARRLGISQSSVEKALKRQGKPRN